MGKCLSSKNIYTIHNTRLPGCKEIICNGFYDNRGISIKYFHKSTFHLLDIKEEFFEDLMVTSKKGVIRGMHFQNPPFGQAKLVYCIKGRIKDVILDIREGSPTYGRYDTIELTEEKRNMLYIPEGFAHGYMALEEDSIIFYKMSNEYNKDYEGGIRWDSFGMNWGNEKFILSERDQSFKKLCQFNSPFVYK
ncbi:dTDP-4-dehydrorhamnose 3,5-epimerase [Sporanaerobium hydrogeniformans]|uniref:dTDP-4-dehydrorhamnose 3,5-epimerase n=2 Tax=Sporanaerobium hydrogeniformans TaxID=3072179 RepID=A0AC61DDH5_9FIRM|nr:dTDP-4-dehydrorhamnose 3,5-epimerase [Sporanaerobium hydrogeniformans]